MDMSATQTMPHEKLFAKGKEVTFEPDFYYSQVNIIIIAEQISLDACIMHITLMFCDRQGGIKVTFTI